MIAYRDFECRGRLKDAVQTANTWVKEQGVRVINVETLSCGGTGSESFTSEMGVRVWYEHA